MLFISQRRKAANVVTKVLICLIGANEEVKAKPGSSKALTPEFQCTSDDVRLDLCDKGPYHDSTGNYGARVHPFHTNSSNDSLLSAIIKPAAHCLDSLAPRLALPTLINYVPTYLSQAL